MTSKNKIYITLIIFALIALILVVFFVFPILKKIRTISEEIISAKNNTATLGVQAKEIENFKKNYLLYKPNLEKMEQLFINEKDSVNFIKFLEKTASDLGITSKISFLPSSDEEKKDFITFQFFSNGDFSKILNFLEKIETGPYLVEIDDLTIKNSSEKVNASFSIKAFTKP